MRKDNTTISHDDGIFIALAISITFVDQKNGESMEHSDNENVEGKLMNPVKMSDVLVRSLRLHPLSSEHTPIFSRVKKKLN